MEAHNWIEVIIVVVLSIPAALGLWDHLKNP